MHRHGRGARAARGRGTARAAGAEGELFYPADVQAISLPSFSGEGQPANGTVTVRYGYVFNGSTKIYGWMVTSHTFDGICYDHMAYASGGALLAGTLCPTAGAGMSSGVSPYQATLNVTLPRLDEDL